MDIFVGNVVWFLAVLSVTTCESTAQCPASSPGDVGFSIISKKNQTGYWNALVHLSHANNMAVSGNQESGAWEVDVRQASQKCGQLEHVDVHVSISAPPFPAGPDYEQVPGLGYERVPGLGYYKIHTTPKSWPQARSTCVEEGAHLAVVNSEKELKALQGIFNLHPKLQDGWQNNFEHVGFHDLFQEGEYLTVLGNSLESTGFSKFAEGEPTGVGESCGCIHRNINGLYDVQCEVPLAFICEQEIY